MTAVSIVAICLLFFGRKCGLPPDGLAYLLNLSKTLEGYRVEDNRMKNYLKIPLLSLFLALMMTGALAQGVAENIGSALGNGNVGGVVRYFDNAVSMTISGSQSTYSRSQAEMVLKDFFAQHTAKGFSLEHTGNNNGNSYAIGTLNTASGSYRVYVAIKQKENGNIVQEIRIEK